MNGLLAVAQAWAVGALIVRLVTDPAGSHWHGPAAWLAGIVVVRACASYVVDVTGARAAAVVSTTLRRRLLEAAARLDPLELSRHRTGELTTLATRGMASVEPYLTRYLPALVLAAVLPAATVLAIFWLDWLSGLIVVLTLPLIPVFAILIGLNTRDRSERQWRELSTLSGHFLDVVRGLPTLVAHRRAGAQSRSIRTITDRYRKATIETLKIAFASSAALELIATLSVALVAVSVGLRLASDNLDFETALIVLLLAPEAYWPWRRVGAEFHSAAEGATTFASATAILESAPAVSATPAPPPEPASLSLEGVGFTYPGRARSALAPTTATLPRTGLVAITGPSGVGKSTLLGLLTGELRPTTGTIRLGERDLADVPPGAWRAHLATAPQQPWLRAGTIAENLRLGRPQADDQALWHALAEVELEDLVATLPHGLDTMLGEDGSGLSAGQRARLSLARTLVAQRPVVLLDEPSAHLDAGTEAVILRTLRALAERALVVVVAHRPAVVELADQVVELSSPGAEGEPAGDELPVVATDGSGPAGGRRVAAESEPEAPSRYGVKTGTLLGALSVASGVALTATAAWLITRASEHPPVLYLMVAIVSVRTFGLARPALRYAERVVSHDAALRILAERRAQVYDALVPLVPGRLGIRRGDLLSSVVDDVDALIDERLRVRQVTWTAALVAGGAVALSALVHPVAALVVAGVCGVGALAYLLAQRGVSDAEPAFVAARAETSDRVESTLHSLRQLELWQVTGSALDALDEAGSRLGSAAVRSARATAAGRLLVGLACGLGLIVMAAVLADPLAQGDPSPALTALLVMLPLALVDALAPLADAGSVAVRTRAARRRLEALTQQPPAIVVPDSVTRVDLAAGDLGHPRGQLDSVSAGWGDEPAVRDLDLDLPSGGRIGLVGPSGVGKSTIAALLMRFLDPVSGRVLWDGRDARDLHPDDIRARVGLVDDDPYIFGSTVVENVRLARPEASDDDVATALTRAHLGDWVASLPHGLETMVGEGYAHVSGGERARLAMARALLADQPVLVLDEPTAHLDADTARVVAGQLLADSDRSVLWITHGTIGLESMDRVVELGEPVDQATVPDRLPSDLV